MDTENKKPEQECNISTTQLQNSPSTCPGVVPRGASYLIRKSLFQEFFSLFFYKICLDLAYCFIISDVWAYAKFKLELNDLKLFESYILLFIVFFFIPKSSNRLSNVLIWLFMLMSYIPMLTLFALTDESRIFMYAVSLFWIMVFLLRMTPTVSIPFFKQSRAIRFLIFIFISCSVVSIIYIFFDFSININLNKVYPIRAKYIKLGIPFSVYLFNSAAYSICPIFFALFLVWRRWFLVVLTIFLQFILFSVTGNKSFAFALMFVSFLMWIVTRKKSFVFLALIYSGIILLGMMSYWMRI